MSFFNFFNKNTVIDNLSNKMDIGYHQVEPEEDKAYEETYDDVLYRILKTSDGEKLIAYYKKGLYSSKSIFNADPLTLSYERGAEDTLRQIINHVDQYEQSRKRK